MDRTPKRRGAPAGAPEVARAAVAPARAAPTEPAERMRRAMPAAPVLLERARARQVVQVRRPARAQGAARVSRVSVAGEPLRARHAAARFAGEPAPWHLSLAQVVRDPPGARREAAVRVAGAAPPRARPRPACLRAQPASQGDAAPRVTRRAAPGTLAPGSSPGIRRRAGRPAVPRSPIAPGARAPGRRLPVAGPCPHKPGAGAVRPPATGRGARSRPSSASPERWGGLPRRGRRAGLTRLARKPAPTGPPSRRARRLPHMENEGARRRRAAPRRPLARASPSAVRIVPLSPEPRRSEPIPLAPPHAPATRPEASYPLLTCAARWPAPTT
jgi:hypothetical protein